MTTFRIETTRHELDLPFCLVTGQVFRFRSPEPGVWTGTDGDLGLRITVVEGPFANPREKGTGMGVEGRGDEIAEDGPVVLDVEATDERAARDFLALDLSLASLGRELAQRSPEIAPTIRSMHGLRRLRRRSVAETLVTFLCTANNHLPRIETMVERIARLGEPGPFGAMFPTLARIAEVPEAEWRAAGFGYRGGTLPKLAAECVARGGERYLSALKGADYAEQTKALTSLPGIGPKLADCVLMLSAGQGLAAPVDVHVWRALGRLYRPDWAGQPLTPARYRDAGALLRDRFGPLAADAQQVLFADELIHWRARR